MQVLFENLVLFENVGWLSSVIWCNLEVFCYILKTFNAKVTSLLHKPACKK